MEFSKVTQAAVGFAVVAIASALLTFPAMAQTKLATPLPFEAGPKIARVVALRPLPVFERVEHPAAAAGRKLVVVEVPTAQKIAFEKDQLHVGVMFAAPRATDNCNETKIYGAILEKDVTAAGVAAPGVASANGLTYKYLDVKPARVSKTLKECNEIKHEVRPVEIVTELRGPSPFRDTLVFDVPEDVEVTATIWSPVATAPGVRVE